MARRDILSDVCRIVYPLPEHPGDDAPEGALDVVSDRTRNIALAREHLRDRLELAWDESGLDPLLAEITDARAELEASERKLRRLITYGREFVEPRPYTLDVLAQAAGMSVSGVRTFYADEEIDAVARLIGARLRRREGDDQAEPGTTDRA